MAEMTAILFCYKATQRYGMIWIGTTKRVNTVKTDLITTITIESAIIINHRLSSHDVVSEGKGWWRGEQGKRLSTIAIDPSHDHLTPCQTSIRQGLFFLITQRSRGKCREQIEFSWIDACAFATTTTVACTFVGSSHLLCKCVQYS